MSRHPIQPVEKDEHGVLRFKHNAIVEHLLEHGGIDMNAIAQLKFSREDREQFAQLIGYSVSGASELGYVSRETIEAAEAMAATGESQDAALARIAADKLKALREALREPMADLFEIHPNDLGGA